MEEKKIKGKIPYPRKCHAFNLQQASLAVTALYDKHMQISGLTIQQFSLLWHIKELSPISVTHLAEAMNLNRTTLSRNLALLKRKGFWEEVPSPGRQRQIQLTPDGLNIFMNAQRAWQTAQDELEDWGQRFNERYQKQGYRRPRFSDLWNQTSDTNVVGACRRPALPGLWFYKFRSICSDRWSPLA